MSQSTGNPSLPLPYARKTKRGSLICIPLRFPLQGGLPSPPLSNRVGGGQKQERGNQPIFPPEKLIGEKKNAEREMKKKKQCKKSLFKVFANTNGVWYTIVFQGCVYTVRTTDFAQYAARYCTFPFSTVEKRGGRRRVPNPCQIWGLLSST